jgi:hypothetical protein
MLAGIVAMQVEVLKLGASIGRSLERGSALQSTNELLRANVASLADDQRIERLAAGMGMVMSAPDAIGFLSSRPGDLQRAIDDIRAPDAAAFLSSLTSAPTTSAPATGPATAASATQTAAASGAETQTSGG